MVRDADAAVDGSTAGDGVGDARSLFVFEPLTTLLIDVLFKTPSSENLTTLPRFRLSGEIWKTKKFYTTLKAPYEASIANLTMHFDAYLLNFRLILVNLIGDKKYSSIDCPIASGNEGTTKRTC